MLHVFSFFLTFSLLKWIFLLTAFVFMFLRFGLKVDYKVWNCSIKKHPINCYLKKLKSLFWILYITSFKNRNISMFLVFIISIWELLSLNHIFFVCVFNEKKPIKNHKICWVLIMFLPNTGKLLAETILAWLVFEGLFLLIWVPLCEMY